MPRVSLVFGLVYVSYVAFAAGLRTARDRVTYQSSGKLLHSGLPGLGEASIDDLNALQSSGSVSSVDLVHAYIRRINEANPLLRAVGEINPDALLIAAALDAERADGRMRGPLHGIPILIKDNIATKDRMNNTAGSYALVGATVSRESTVVAKLRDAGAVILGKATMGEWAQMRSRKSSSSAGWSAYGGQVLGAYYSMQDPGGSSSGSAVAPSVGLALGALGTETSGSIVLPAEKSNIVGIKPTLGLTSRSMVIPISLRQDTVGPMARTVKDVAYMLTAISGKDKHDNWTSVQPFEVVPDYARACDYSALKGARLGVPRNGISPFLSSSTEPIMSAFEDALAMIKGAGARIIDEADFESFDPPAFHRNSSIVLDTDFVTGVSDYLSLLERNPNEVYNLHDLAQFTRNDPREAYPDRDIYVWDRELNLNITNESAESHDAYQANLRMAEEHGVIGALNKYNLDALVMPTFASFQLPAIAGLPVITVPLGFYPANTPLVMNPKATTVSVAPNMPFGIAFIGRRWSEETLIALAYAFEQRTMTRQRMRPYISPTFELGDQRNAVPRPDASNSGSAWIVLDTMQAIVKRTMAGLLSGRGWIWAVLGIFETVE